MAVLIFWLVVLVTLGNFADFVLGQKGGRRAKDRLVDFYVSINASNWSGIFRWVGRAMDEFMDKYLGRPFSSRYFSRVLILSLPASTLAGIYIMIDPQGRSGNSINSSEAIGFLGNISINLIPYWVSGYAVDLLSWNFAQRAFRFLSKSRSIGIAVAIFAIFVAIYLAIIITLFLLFTIEFILFPVDGLDINVGFFAKNALVAFLVASYGLLDRYNGIPSIVVVAPVIIPYALFIIVLIVCAVASHSQNIVQKPLSVIIQRAEESPKGIFTLGATAIASFIAILTAAEKALS